MIDIVVLLEIKDPLSFKEYETQAIAIMKKYGGKLLSAFEPDKTESSPNHISEIHYLQFPDPEAFKQYRSDEQLQALSKLRTKAIANTTMYVSGKLKTYPATT